MKIEERGTNTSARYTAISNMSVEEDGALAAPAAGAS